MKIIWGFLLMISLSGCFSSNSKITSGLEGKQLPSFNLQLIDSTKKFNTAMIASGKPFMLICFLPNCTHCQAETEDILENIEKFKDIHIYMITPFPLTYMKQFSAHYQLDKYPNITAAVDTSNSVLKYFNSSAVPYTAVYNSKKCLKQAFIGETDIDNLKNIITE